MILNDNVFMKFVRYLSENKYFYAVILSKKVIILNSISLCLILESSENYTDTNPRKRQIIS